MLGFHYRDGLGEHEAATKISQGFENRGDPDCLFVKSPRTSLYRRRRIFSIQMRLRLLDRLVQTPPHLSRWAWAAKSRCSRQRLWGIAIGCDGLSTVRSTGARRWRWSFDGVSIVYDGAGRYQDVQSRDASYIKYLVLKRSLTI